MTAITPPRTLLSQPHGCTFDPGDWQILARHWYPVALTRDIGTDPVGAQLLDQPLVIYRAGDDIVIANDLCPHRGVPLTAGTGDGTAIACRFHGLRFGAAGRCVAVPAHPDRKIPDRLHLTTYPAVERYGLVWTSLDPAADPESLPVMRYWDKPGFQQIACPALDAAACASRQVEGFLDVAHFGFVHANTFGDPTNVVVPDYQPKRTDYGFEADYYSTLAAGPSAPADFLWLRRWELFVPFTVTLTTFFPDDGVLNILNAASPMSFRTTRVFTSMARNFGADEPLEDVYEFNRRIFEEDRAIVEIQKPEYLPLDPDIEVNIPADRSSVAYRRALRELGLSAPLRA
ncbi:aromatic ring-hydroxylating oxygenase subunit alpha [Nocardia terpenica]|uniref:Rieske 2Fe-2S domain-containing protein n=1 Tax=Nocardia terpenica TaxID=455432 RepID=A0A6G9YY97_9NOCA|nr:aromatic ring-hydroxylating dioxygenase subunit alpha [Nocardia terpenica]QIS18309.1 Rieske 2Fe-2S domain-containing protein [Nocardia terpenica]